MKRVEREIKFKGFVSNSFRFLVGRSRAGSINYLHFSSSNKEPRREHHVQVHRREAKQHQRLVAEGRNDAYVRIHLCLPEPALPRHSR